MDGRYWGILEVISNSATGWMSKRFYLFLPSVFRRGDFLCGGEKLRKDSWFGKGAWYEVSNGTAAMRENKKEK